MQFKYYLYLENWQKQCIWFLGVYFYKYTKIITILTCMEYIKIVRNTMIDYSYDVRGFDQNGRTD